MTTETIIGFDSAWTDRNLGAICSITVSEGELVDFKSPRLVQFEEATLEVEEANLTSGFVLVALDQPTLVPNLISMRPVERVAGSIVNKIGGGVQPANRGRTSMFGDEAPVWQFLNRIGARENPVAARNASNGLFLIEVFPALALPSLVPAIWHRKRAAKYNPAGRGFSTEDWQLVTRGIASVADQFGVRQIATASNELAMLSNPRKSDQDKLDALICLTIGWSWRRRPRDTSLVIGDHISGYMVTPVNNETKAVLVEAASRKRVPLDGPWSEDARRTHSEFVGGEPLTPRYKPVRKPVRNVVESNLEIAASGKYCPECGHEFSGAGWGGIDAHWRKYHEDIMPYHSAWPIIRGGGKPSSHKEVG